MSVTINPIAETQSGVVISHADWKLVQAKFAGKSRRGMSAAAFFDAYQMARKAVASAIGDRWVILGHATWCTVPSGLRSFRSERGTKISLPHDIRLPPACYWPGGEIPDGLIMETIHIPADAPVRVAA
jgi:hypothetical protein